MAVPTPDGFTLKPVANRTVGGLTGSQTLGLILHVQAGTGALTGWFNNPAAQASSTWWAGKGGQREQYGNPDTDKFWAQAAGNSTYHSIETEGQPSEALTAAQIETVAVAYAWGHTRYGWPFQLAEKPGDRGLGWHGMGGKAWGGHTGCPGDIRKAQRKAILARAQQLTTSTTEEDMPLNDDDLAKVARSVWGYKNNDTSDAYEYLRNGIAADTRDAILGADVIPAPVKQDGNPNWTVGASLEWTGKGVAALQAAFDPAKIAAAVAAAMPDGKTATQADVEAALRNVLGSLDNKES